MKDLIFSLLWLIFSITLFIIKPDENWQLYCVMGIICTNIYSSKL